MTSTEISQESGARWAAVGADQHVAELNSRGWPILRAATDPCDGINPATGRPCLRFWHNAYHRDEAGAEWLDDE